MKTARYSEPQILAILRQAEGGVPVAGGRALPRTWYEHGVLLHLWMSLPLQDFR